MKGIRMKIENLPLTNLFVVLLSGLLCGLFASILPAMSFLLIIPFIALIYSEKPARLKMYSWGVFWYFGTIWWMAIVNLQGLQPLIFFATIGLSLFLALRFLLVGVLSAFVLKRCPKVAILFIPSVWVVSEYVLTLGELSFPWMFSGYSLSPLFYLSQVVSITGIWGLSFLAVISAVVLYNLVFFKRGKKIAVSLACVVAMLCLWGFVRVRPVDTHEIKAIVLQPNADMENWYGFSSLMECMEVLDSLLDASTNMDRGIFILPESAIFTHLRYQPSALVAVGSWLRRHNSHIIFGSLTPIRGEGGVDGAYNTAYWASPELSNLYDNYARYHKIKLVPFVETTPFSAALPMISRLDLRGGSFVSGSEYSVWEIEDLRIAPFICYENVYPEFTRRRVNHGAGANLMINITNDGWFGRTTAPIQHAEMTRVRAIELGISMVRSANTGISFSVDPFGRFLAKTEIYTREVVQMPIAKALNSTIYRRFGDWFAIFCVLFSLFWLVYPSIRKK